MPFYQKGDVRIRYEEIGSGFPLLVTPGGGLNSRVSNWPTAVINAMEEFKHDFRCITMDQRNANGGESSGSGAGRERLGRLRRRPARADGPSRDPRILLHGLLHRRLLRRQAAAAGAPARRGRRVLPDGRPSARRPGRHDSTQPAELAPGFPDTTARGVDGDDREISSTASGACSPISSTACRASSSANCPTPILVLPDDTSSHPLQTSIDVASLAPNAEITVFPWREPPELKARTINRVRTFLKSHVPMRNAAQ